MLTCALGGLQLDFLSSCYDIKLWGDANVPRGKTLELTKRSAWDQEMHGGQGLELMCLKVAET